MIDFCSLHNHTVYSLMDSLIWTEDLFKRAKELGQTSIAITDHATLASAWDGLKLSKQHGVKLIMGCEFCFVDDVSDENAKLRHIILLAKNYNGYKNLLLANKLANDNNVILFKKAVPRIDWNILEKCHDGLICTTACGNGILSQLINNRQEDTAKTQAQRLKDIFGTNLALEIQPHAMQRNAGAFNGYEDQALVNNTLIKFGKQLDIKVVAATNAHYLTKEKYKAHDALVAIGCRMPVRSSSRLKYTSNDFYMKSRDEVCNFFRRLYKDQAEEFCDNTLYFSNLCEEPVWIDPKYSNPSGKELPEFPVADQPDYNQFQEWKNEQSAEINNISEDALYLRYLCKVGLANKIPPEKRAEYQKRLNDEFSVIEYHGFSSYMLIVADYINYCKKNNIPVGPGRGCLVGKTQVLTTNGFKQLQDISVGDIVFGHSGEQKPVTKVFEYNIDEELLSIKTNKSFENIVLTKDHEVFASQDKTQPPTWIQAGLLSVGDYVYCTFPKRNKKHPIQQFNLKHLFPYLTDDDFNNRHHFANSFSLNEISRQTNVSREFVRKLKNKTPQVSNTNYNSINKVSEYLNSLGKSIDDWKSLENFNDYGICPIIKLDKEFSYFLGRWAGDGCFHGGYDKARGITISFNSNDISGITRICDYTKTINLHPIVCKAKNANATNVTILSKPLVSLFKYLFKDYRNSYTKHLPVCFRKFSDINLIQVINGLIDSDGTKTGNSTIITTISKRLALEIREVLWYLKRPSAIYLETNKFRYNVPTKDCYKVSFKLDNEKASGYYCKIKDIGIEKYNKVYDIKVKDDHSYLTSNYIVHNSVGGSLIGYLTDIHTADPIKYGLIFARFLNKFKTEFPDIDVDFSSHGKEVVQNYIRNKYGEDKVAHVSNINTMTPKVYARDIARAFEFGGSQKSAVELGNAIADSIPDDINTLEDALENAPLFAEYASVTEYSPLKDFALDFDGIPKAWSTHAGGLVIGKRPLVECVPSRKDKDGNIALEYDKGKAEQNGLVKMDILGVSTLDIIINTLKIINSQGKKCSYDEITSYDSNDNKTYELISSGDTSCIFQFGSSAGTIDLCKKIKPICMEDLAVINAIARPNAEGIRKNFIEARNNKKIVELLHPYMKRALESTYGFAVFEECLMYLAQDVAGWDLHDADRLRKLTKEKGKNPKAAAEWREDFINCAVKNKQLSHNMAMKIWDDVISPFSGYSFNKSHAIAYSFLGYQTAYLKAHFPLEFLTANLMFEVKSNNPDARENALQIRNEIRHKKVKILPPNINTSDMSYSIINDNTLLTGFDSLKYMGNDAIPEIIEKRPFISFDDFLSRVDARKVRMPSVQAMIASGCFDLFGMTRKQMYLYASDYRKKLQVWNKKKPQEQFIYPWPENIGEWTNAEKYALESYYIGEGLCCGIKEAYAGFFDNYAMDFSTLQKKFPDTGDPQDRYEVTMNDGVIEGVIRDYFEFKVKKETSKIFGQTIAKINLEDPFGNIVSMTLFPSGLRKLNERMKMLTGNKVKIEPGVAVHCACSVNWYENNLSIIFNDLKRVQRIPQMPKDLESRKVSMRIMSSSRKSKTVKIDPQEFLEFVEDELIEEGKSDEVYSEE